MSPTTLRNFVIFLVAVGAAGTGVLGLLRPIPPGGNQVAAGERLSEGGASGTRREALSRTFALLCDRDMLLLVALLGFTGLSLAFWSTTFPTLLGGKLPGAPSLPSRFRPQVPPSPPSPADPQASTPLLRGGGAGRGCSRAGGDPRGRAIGAPRRPPLGDSGAGRRDGHVPAYRGRGVGVLRHSRRGRLGRESGAGAGVRLPLRMGRRGHELRVLYPPPTVLPRADLPGVCPVPMLPGPQSPPVPPYCLAPLCCMYTPCALIPSRGRDPHNTCVFVCAVVVRQHVRRAGLP